MDSFRCEKLLGVSSSASYAEWISDSHFLQVFEDGNAFAVFLQPSSHPASGWERVVAIVPGPGIPYPA